MNCSSGLHDYTCHGSNSNTLVARRVKFVVRFAHWSDFGAHGLCHHHFHALDYCTRVAGTAGIVADKLVVAVGVRILDSVHKTPVLVVEGLVARMVAQVVAVREAEQTGPLAHYLLVRSDVQHSKVAFRPASL